jgi:hypothetical protein
MRLPRIVMAAVLLFILASTSVQSQSPQSVNLCESAVKAETECFAIHGRMEVTAGLRIRIWVIGTKRILGVDDYSYAMPKNITELLKTDNRIYADFVVCPITPDKPGHMRFIQVCRASNLVLETYDEVSKQWRATRIKGDNDSTGSPSK